MKRDDWLSGADETYSGVVPALRRVDAYLSERLDVNVDAGLAEIRERAGASGPRRRVAGQRRPGRGRRRPVAAVDHATPSTARRHRWVSVRLHGRLAVAAAAFAMVGALALAAVTSFPWRSTQSGALLLVLAGGGGAVLAATTVRTLANVVVTWMKVRSGPAEAKVMPAMRLISRPADELRREIDKLAAALNQADPNNSGDKNETASPFFPKNLARTIPRGFCLLTGQPVGVCACEEHKGVG